MGRKRQSNFAVLSQKKGGQSPPSFCSAGFRYRGAHLPPVPFLLHALLSAQALVVGDLERQKRDAGKSGDDNGNCHGSFLPRTILVTACVPDKNASNMPK